MKFLVQRIVTPIEAVSAAFVYLEKYGFEAGLSAPLRSESFPGFYLREYTDSRARPLVAIAATFELIAGRRKADALFDRFIREFFNSCLAGPCPSGGRLVLFAPGFDRNFLSRLKSLRLVGETLTVERYDYNGSFSAYRCFKQRVDGLISSPASDENNRGESFFSESQGASLAEEMARLLPGCIPHLHKGRFNLINQSGLAVASLIPLAGARYRLVVGPAGTRRHTISREVRNPEDIFALKVPLQERAAKLKSVKAPESKLATLLRQDRLRGLSHACNMDLTPIESPPRPMRGPVDLFAYDRKTNRRILVELKANKDPLILWQVSDYYRSLSGLFGERGLGPALLVAPEFHGRLFELARLLDFETVFITFDRKILNAPGDFRLPLKSLQVVCHVRPRKLSEEETALLIRNGCAYATRRILDRLEQVCGKIGLIRFIPSQRIIAYRLHLTSRPIPIIHLDPQPQSVTFAVRLDRLERASIDAGRTASAFKSLFPGAKLTRCFIKSEIADERSLRAAELFLTILGEEIELSACFDCGNIY